MADSWRSDPRLELEVVSRVGCKWCERLKAYLSSQDANLVAWHESKELDPEAEDYASRREGLLERAGRVQFTFPFVFDVRTGRLVGGHDATVALVEATKTVDWSLLDAGAEDF